MTEQTGVEPEALRGTEEDPAFLAWVGRIRGMLIAVGYETIEEQTEALGDFVDAYEHFEGQPGSLQDHLAT